MGAGRFGNIGIWAKGSDGDVLGRPGRENDGVLARSRSQRWKEIVCISRMSIAMKTSVWQVYSEVRASKDPC